MVFVGFNLCQRLFFNKIAGTVHVHPFKLINIYTHTSIYFKPFSFSKLNVTCNYQKSVTFNGSWGKANKITSISFSCLLQLPKSLFKVKGESATDEQVHKIVESHISSSEMKLSVFDLCQNGFKFVGWIFVRLKIDLESDLGMYW